MTKLRTSEVSDESVQFRDERISLFGAPVYDQVSPNERFSGAFSSLGQGTRITGFGYARDQWWSLKDYAMEGESQQLTLERYEEMRNDPYMGELEIPYDPTLTERQFTNQLKRFRRDNYMQTYDRNLGGKATSFVGAMAGGMLAPEILATLPVGGPMFHLASRAKTTAEMLRLSLGGGLQVSAVATPLNIYAQETVYGQVDPMEVAFTAVAPIVFAPPGVAFGRLFTRAERQSASSGAQTKLPDPVRETPDDHVPLDLTARFEGFDGGAENWLTQIAARNPVAVDFARSIGIGERELNKLFDITLRESAATPQDTRAIQDFDALTAYASGSETPAQLRWMWARGLTKEADAARAAQSTQPYLRTIDDLLAQKNIAQRRAEIETNFPELAAALGYRDFAFSAAGRPNNILRQQVADLGQAVRDKNPDLAPAELRDTARKLIDAAGKDRGTQRIAYRDEMKDLNLIERAMQGKDAELREFAGRFINKLPTEAKKDFEAFRNGGLEAVRVRHLQRASEQMDAQVARMGELVEARLGKKGRASKEYTAQKKETQAAIDALEAELARLRPQSVREPQSVSVDELAELLGAPQSAAPAAPKVTPDTTVQAQPARQLDEKQMDQLIDDYEAFAREAGVDIATIDNGFTRAAKVLETCT